jgi:hypothetical protein
MTDTRGKHVPFGIKREDRSRHMYTIGKTGMGKSTLLENMAIQDILHGEGVCFIDPHGGTAEKLIEFVPEHRMRDVLYFAPFDLQYPVSFNVLENVEADRRHFVVAGLMSTFEKIWADAWSARMSYILQNTIAALLEFPGATLLGVNRMYIDKEYRKNVIANISDPATRSFWVDEYSKYTDKYAQEATPAIQNKIGQFASNALVRNIIGQEQSSFNMRELMDKKKIFIVNLSKGRIGEGNANLLGSMLITKIYLSAMSRADATPAEMRALPPFFLFVDEFQNFANKSFADILSEARKYKLSLTIAHQYIEQMEEEVRAAVFGNVGTMLAFRVGSFDADVLEKEFAPVFTAEDLVNLSLRQTYLKLMIDGVSSQPFSASTLPPIPDLPGSPRERVIAYSRARYSRPRDEVEADIRAWHEKKYEDPEVKEKERAREERRGQGLQEGGVAQTRFGAQGNTRGDTRPPQRFNDRYDGRERDNRPQQGTQRQPFSGRPSRENERQFSPRPKQETPRVSHPPLPQPPSHATPSSAQNNLRNTLTRVVGKVPPLAPPIPPKSSQFQPYDDAKGLTPEGKQDLRAVLDRFARYKKEPPSEEKKDNPHVSEEKKKEEPALNADVVRKMLSGDE